MHNANITLYFNYLDSGLVSDWDEVFSEAVSRLNKPDPIFWMVAIEDDEKEDFVRIGDASYFSGMYIDDKKKLQLTNPNLKAADLKPFCECCTHTFNGKIFEEVE